jgi:hypothetical protein
MTSLLWNNDGQQIIYDIPEVALVALMIVGREYCTIIKARLPLLEALDVVPFFDKIVHTFQVESANSLAPTLSPTRLCRMARPNTIIIGAGASGIAMAHSLKCRLGYNDFEVSISHTGDNDRVPNDRFLFCRFTTGKRALVELGG